MNVVVVESPAKAKTINKYLGPDYRVLASYGHVRDLPSKDGSVEPDRDFAMKWETDPKAKRRIDEIYTAHPFLGSRKITVMLIAQGDVHIVNIGLECPLFIGLECPLIIG